MKKLASILILLILIFNIIGYRFVLNYLENKSVAVLEQVIETNSYIDSDLCELQIPLNMPYYSDSKLETISGEINLQGKIFSYVKRKIENNILHIWCLSNTEKNNLITAKNYVAKSNSQENHSNSNQKQNIVIKLLQTEFLPWTIYNFSNTYSITTQHQLVINHSCTSQFNPLGLIKPPNFI